MTERQPEIPAVSYVDLSKARVDEQLEVMKTIDESGDCPFCPENIVRLSKIEVLRKGALWVLGMNEWPYKNTEKHLLAIATYHAESLSDLRPGAFDELQEHAVWAEQELDIKSGGLCMRFGDITQNGATVNHIHAHLIVPRPHSADEEVDKKVRFKIW